MKKAGISEARTKKMRTDSQTATAQMASSRRIAGCRTGSGFSRQSAPARALPWPALFLLRRQLPVISSKRSLECIRARHLRHRHRLAAGVEHTTMNTRPEPSLQRIRPVPLLIGQPFSFYDRQSKKNFGSFLTKDRQQAYTQRRKARVARRCCSRMAGSRNTVSSGRARGISSAAFTRAKSKTSRWG